MYDLLIKDGKIVDGSGIPAFNGDVGITNGRIVAVGKLSGTAQRVLNAGGQALAPGIVDSHCHYDAQVTWDPLCTYSPHHGVTTVVIGNCSLAMAPAHKEDREVLAQILSRVEAIPLEAIEAGVKWDWETVPEYMDVLDRRLGVNVACLIGHSAVRRYVMGEASQEREATEDETARMKAVIREGIESGAVGMSFERNLRHFDYQGRLTPTNLASDEEVLSLARVVDELGRGVVQYGGDRSFGPVLAQAIDQPVFYSNITQSVTDPDVWRKALTQAETLQKQGKRSYTFVMTRPGDQRFTMRTAQHFDAMPEWKRVMMLPFEQRKQAFRDAAVRAQLREEAKYGFPLARWNVQLVFQPVLEKNSRLKGQSIVQIAKDRGKEIVDALLDLALEEDLDTEFERREVNSDDEAMDTLLNSPYTVIGQSDGGAHVLFRTDYSQSTYMLSHWVREKGIMSLEEAIRRMTFVPASLFGLYDKGLVRPGMAADLMVFDPDTIAPLEPGEANDLPAGARRRKQLAQGIQWTIVNGEVLMDDGEHTGAHPGKVARSLGS